MEHPDEGTIHAWLDDALSPTEATALEAHVAQCAACAAAVAEARGFLAASSRIVSALDDVPINVIPQVAPTHSRAIAVSGARVRRAWWNQPGLAAAALLFVTASSVVLRHGSGSDIAFATVADSVSIGEAAPVERSSADAPAQSAVSAGAPAPASASVPLGASVPSGASVPLGASVPPSASVPLGASAPLGAPAPLAMARVAPSAVVPVASVPKADRRSSRREISMSVPADKPLAQAPPAPTSPLLSQPGDANSGRLRAATGTETGATVAGGTVRERRASDTTQRSSASELQQRITVAKATQSRVTVTGAAQPRAEFGAAAPLPEVFLPSMLGCYAFVRTNEGDAVRRRDVASEFRLTDSVAANSERPQWFTARSIGSNARDMQLSWLPFNASQIRVRTIVGVDTNIVLVRVRVMADASSSKEASATRTNCPP